MASTNGYDKSAMYLAYAILAHIVPPVLGWYHMLTSENEIYMPFNANCSMFVHWTLNLILNGYLIVTLGKQRIQKLILEIKKLDKMMSFSDKALVNKMVACNTFWVGSIVVFNLSIVARFGQPIQNLKHALILTSFITVDVAMMSEVACFCCFAVLVYTRLRHFVLHLNLLLNEKRRDKGTDVTLCYRQIHRALERLVKACQVQIVAAMYFYFLSCLRILIQFIQMKINWTNIFFDLVSMSAFLGSTALVGALGQAVRSQLARLRRLALLMEHCPNGELQSGGRRIVSEGAVRARGLRALGVRLAGALPLRFCGELATAVILLLQLDITLRYQ